LTDNGKEASKATNITQQLDCPEKILSAKGGGVGEMEMEIATIAVTMTINDNKFIN